MFAVISGLLCSSSGCHPNALEIILVASGFKFSSRECCTHIVKRASLLLASTLESTCVRVRVCALVLSGSSALAADNQDARPVTSDHFHNNLRALLALIFLAAARHAANPASVIHYD